MLVAPLPEQDSPRGRPRAVLTSAARYARNENAGSVAKRAVPAIRRAQTKGCLVLSACVCRVVKTSRVSCEGLRACGPPAGKRNGKAVPAGMQMVPRHRLKTV